MAMIVSVFIHFSLLLIHIYIEISHCGVTKPSIITP